MSFKARLFALLVLLGCLAPTVEAHETGQSYIFLRLYGEDLEARLELAIEDLNDALGLDLPTDVALDDDVVRPHLDSILAYVQSRLYMGSGGEPLPLSYRDFTVRRVEGITYVHLFYETDGLGDIPDEIEIEYDVFYETDTLHRNLVLIEHNWETSTFENGSVVSLVLGPSDGRQTLDLSDASVWRGFWGVVKLGMWHIWIGIDHILFLLALILPSVLRREDGGHWVPVPSFRPALINIVSIVTFFTIAHSITLSLAALNVIQLPSRLVESIIAASIAAAALHNLYPRFKVREWVIAFVFGLFHGLGFASVLSHLSLGQSNTVLSLLGFNLGVEIGQVAVVCLLFPLLYVLRTRRFYLPMMRYLSMALIAVASFWFVERALDVPLTRKVRRVIRAIL